MIETNNNSNNDKFETGSDWTSKSGNSVESLILDLDDEVEDDVIDVEQHYRGSSNRGHPSTVIDLDEVDDYDDDEVDVEDYNGGKNNGHPISNGMGGSPTHLMMDHSHGHDLEGGFPTSGTSTGIHHTFSPTNVVMMTKKKNKKKKDSQKSPMTTMAGIRNPYGGGSDDSESDSSSIISYEEDEDDDVRSQDTPIPKVPPPVQTVSPRRFCRSKSGSTTSSSNTPTKREESKVSRLVVMAKQQQNFAQAWFAAATSRNANALPKFPSRSKRNHYKKQKSNNDTSSSTGPIDIDSGNSWNDESDDDDTKEGATNRSTSRWFARRYIYTCFFSIFCVTLAAIAFVIVMAVRQRSSSDIPQSVPQLESLSKVPLPPSYKPSRQPSLQPSLLPTLHFSKSPSHSPSTIPTVSPSLSPTRITSSPSTDPSMEPSQVPSRMPSFVPSEVPTELPSIVPSDGPSGFPSVAPTGDPSVAPSRMPSAVPSQQPSTSHPPSQQPSMVPTTEYSSRKYLPLGQSIASESPTDSHGYSVALSRDGKVKAVGARYFPSMVTKRGSVSLYQLVNNQWMPMGSRLEGRNSKDEFGYAIALSSDGSILAASEPTYDNRRGNVRVFQFNQTLADWVPMGSDIYINETLTFFGTSISLSADGTILAVGAPLGGSYSTGRVHLFQYNDNTDWTPMGTFLEGSELNDFFGWDVSLSADGHHVACGGPRRPSGGFVRVYQWSNDDQWTSKGSDIVAVSQHSSANNRFGWSVSISDDGQRVAIGSPNTIPGGTSVFYSGMATVFDYSSSSWQPLGDSLYGHTTQSQQFGWSVALSGDGHHLAVGAPGHDAMTGAVFLHQLSSLYYYWEPNSNPLKGSNVLEEFGWDVTITPDGNTVCVGSPYQRNNILPGIIHVYSYQPTQNLI